MKYSRLILIICIALRRTSGAHSHSLYEGGVPNDLSKLEAEVERLQKSLKNLQDNAEDDAVTEDGAAIDEILFINELNDVTGVHDIDIRDDPFSEDESGNVKRNAVRNPDRLWKSRDIGYELGRNLTLEARKVIPEAMKVISSVSCIKFHPRRREDKEWLKFKKLSGCFSLVGKSRSAQTISIGEGCEHVGVVMHEILHALGFYHEQSRYDRDRYVEIKWENMVPGREFNFRKLTPEQSRNMGTPYDYNSIMHYGKKSFSKNGQDVIVKIGDPKGRLGQSTLSDIDKTSLNLLYHCYDTVSNGKDHWTEWSDYGACHMLSKDMSQPCYKRRYRFCAGKNCLCTRASNGVTKCTTEKVACTDSQCRVNGHWGHWSLWSACSALGRCRNGTKGRTRSCNNPAPRKGGNKCVGVSSVVTKCTSICPQHCTFNEDTCGYTLKGRWVHSRGATPSKRTGPGDDVDGNGMYVYTEVSGAEKNFESRLESPIFNATAAPRCFSMWYHMYGGTMGRLQVYLKQVGGMYVRKFEIKGNKGNTWRKVEFNVHSPLPFTMVFNAFRGASYTGDLALDNLFLHERPCGATPLTTTTRAVTSSSTTTSTSTSGSTTTTSTSTSGSTTTASTSSSRSTTTASTSSSRSTTTASTSTSRSTTTASTSTSGSTTTPMLTTTPFPDTAEPPQPKSLLLFNCSFNDADMCGMEMISNYLGVPSTSVLHWHIMNVGHGVDPIQDRVVERGYFLNVHAAEFQDIEKTSIVRTRLFKGDGERSIGFFYYMWSEDLPLAKKHNRMGSLEVSLVEVGSGKSCVLFTTSGSRNGVWEYAWLNVDVKPGVMFYLKFAAILGKVNSTIAIDDISGLPGRTFGPRASVTSPSVLSCSFNSAVNSFCAWKLSGSMEWSTRNGSSLPVPVTAVTNDHYAYVNTSSSDSMGDVAQMISPIIMSRTPMCLVFYSNTYGKDIDSSVLRVQVWSSRQPIVKDLIQLSTSRDWKQNKSRLPVNRLFVVNFRAVIGTGSEAVMAIDNVNVIPGSCAEPAVAARTICDFENIRRCKKSGLKSFGFYVWWGKAPNKSYYKARLSKGRADVKFPVTTDQFGSCLQFQYRVKTGYHRVGYIKIAYYGEQLPNSESVVMASPKGLRWQLHEVTIKPGVTTVKLYVKFGSKVGEVKEVNIDNIRIISGICKKAVTV